MRLKLCLHQHLNISSPTKNTKKNLIRVSSWFIKGKYQTTLFIKEAYLYLITDPPTFSHEQPLIYNTYIMTHFSSDILYYTDPRAYTAKTRNGKDPDN